QKPHPRLNALRDNPHIHITGWVEAVQPYLAAADVYIAPLRMGSGTRLKILEAMASQCAMVVTSAAAAGLTQEAHESMHIADEPAQLAVAIIDLLQHPEKRVKLGQRASTCVRSHYDWSVLIPRLLNVYREVGLE
ncbi:MAG: glycosyltransferase, partial [Chloroflexota bacterium]